VGAVNQVISDNKKYLETGWGDVPAPETVAALQAAAKTYNPTGIFLDTERAIRMEFFDLKDRWDLEFPE